MYRRTMNQNITNILLRRLFNNINNNGNNNGNNNDNKKKQKLFYHNPSKL